MKKDALNQKGANGIIAEYACAMHLHTALEKGDYSVKSSAQTLRRLLNAKVAQFSGELTKAQVDRALRQGEALGDYIYQSMAEDPAALMLPEGVNPSHYCHDVVPTGHITIKEDSSDVVIRMVHLKKAGVVLECPISLKAYRGTTTSQGSKGGKAALTRLFLFKEKASDVEFAAAFGAQAKRYMDHLALFKKVAKEFYNGAPEGKAFIAAYRARKGPNAKVNNPLRRKELGDYFEAKTGELSEHTLAKIYVSLFNDGFGKLIGRANKHHFSEALRFVLGIEKQFVTLNAICLANGPVKVENSATSGQHARLHRILASDYTVRFKHKPGSSIVSVDFVSQADTQTLSLAVWKDGTIQFKMDSTADG